MLGKKPNKIYDPFLKAGLGYQNPERLKKAIATQPKMYDEDMLHSEKLIINSTNSEETLEDAEESQNKMKNKMIQVNYDKINTLYETFVPQQKFFAEQTYFSIRFTSNHSSESKDVLSESPVLKMPNESRLLKMMDKLGDALTGFYTKINKTLLKDAERRWLSDSKNELREFLRPRCEWRLRQIECEGETVLLCLGDDCVVARRRMHWSRRKEKKKGHSTYGKLILDLGNEVHSSLEQGMAAMEKLVEKLGNTEDKVECKKLKKELKEA
ncbi:hypothetical protein Tco_1577546 [Tanacetum coccineum]